MKQPQPDFDLVLTAQRTVDGIKTYVQGEHLPSLEVRHVWCRFVSCGQLRF